jgi:hypothetical protein
MKSLRSLYALPILMLAVAVCARTPDYADAAEKLNAEIASSESAGHGIVVVYVDDDGEGVSRSIGRWTVMRDGEHVGRLHHRKRYLLFAVRAGAHSIGIDQGRVAIARQVIHVVDGSRHFLRYAHSVHATGEALFRDIQISNQRTLETVDEDTARERIATIQGVVTARGR